MPLALVVSSVAFVFIFFFQAEDGIRDDLVTGVQTCALPISSPCRRVQTLFQDVCFGRLAIRGTGQYRPAKSARDGLIVDHVQAVVNNLSGVRYAVDST